MSTDHLLLKIVGITGAIVSIFSAVRIVTSILVAVVFCFNGSSNGHFGIIRRLVMLMVLSHVVGQRILAIYYSWLVLLLRDHFLIQCGNSASVGMRRGLSLGNIRVANRGRECFPRGRPF